MYEICLDLHVDLPNIVKNYIFVIINVCVCAHVQVVVRLSDELLSQAVMVVESCRPTLTINLAGARQHWLEGMLRHEIGNLRRTHTHT